MENTYFLWMLNKNIPGIHGKLAQIIEDSKDNCPIIMVAGRSQYESRADVERAGRIFRATSEYAFRFANIGDKCVIDTECESGFLESWLDRGKEVTIKEIVYGNKGGSITEPDDLPICVTDGKDIHWLGLYALKLKE